MNINLAFVSEAGSEMGRFIMKDKSKNGSKIYGYGIGSLVFGMMNTIADRLVADEEIMSCSRSLLLFRERMPNGGCHLVSIPDSKLHLRKSYCEIFHYHMLHTFAKNRAESLMAPVNEFGTEGALQKAIANAASVPTILVFSALAPDILASIPQNSLIVSTKERGEQITPTLSLFFLSDNVPPTQLSELSRLNTLENNVCIFCERTLVESIREFQLRGGNMSIEAAVSAALDARCGLPYAIYGLIKNSLKIPASYDAGSAGFSH